MRRLWLAPFLLSLALFNLHAQLRGGMSGLSVGDVHVHVVLENQRNAGPYLVVRLMMESSTGMVVATGYTNDVGEVSFNGIPIGNYHVEVTGDGISDASSQVFEVDNRKMSQAQFVVVHQVEDSGPKPLSARSPMVSANDLKVPEKARKEVDKANENMALHDWKKAKEHLDKALAIYPDYVTAYNNLSVLYAKTDDLAKEEEALKKAISLDEHFAPALLNYGKLCFKLKNFPQAESLLQREVAADPDDPESMMLLADSEYMNRHFDAAIATANQAHSSSHEHASFVHYIAARAYQQENQQPQALAEFQMFLKEEPKGPRADHVRADIAKIESANQQASAAPQ
jgi:tetratricopeptide (TPR) repeat protein